MSLISFVGQVISDTRSCGIGFAVTNFRQRWGSGTPEFTLGGRQLIVRAGNSDYQTFRQVFRDREYAITQPEMALRIEARFTSIKASGRVPVIVDAGANVGAAALWFVDTYPGSTVVAVEPDPQNAAILQRNLASTLHATVLEAAIGAEAGFAAVSQSDGGWATQTSRADQGVAILTIDQAAATVPNGELFLVKVDIEGFESDLFASNLDWLDRVSAVFVEPHDWMLPARKTSRTFQRAFAARDFDLLMIGENLLFVRGA